MIPIRVKESIRYFFGYLIVWILATHFYAFLRSYGDNSFALSSTRKLILIQDFFQTTIIGLTLGLSFILVDGILKNKWIKKHSYTFNILVAILLHTVTFYLVIMVNLYFFNIENSQIPIKQFIINVFSAPNLIVAFVYFNLVIVILNVERYVRKIFGPGAMIKIVLGKYYRPRNEERVFMFLDLVSSTTYAERIGSLKFIELIQDCFFEVSTIVKKYDAEIYQYVGDEVILTWKKDRGAWKNNAFHAFFDYLEILDKKADYFNEKYGMLPVFKAGVHFGIASVGEVGDIKKEIAFMGDAVNVSSRLMGLCNKYKKAFLASKEMVDLAHDDGHLKFEFLEETLLKGKQSPTKIYSVERV